MARIKTVTARNGDRTLEVKADAYVLAAGTIESTRILLEMEREYGEPFRRGSGLGRYLSDHLSCRVANVLTEDRVDCARTFGPHFSAGRMRTFRFVERNLTRDVPRCFFHFMFDHAHDGFHVARKALLGLQSRKLPDISLDEVARAVPGLFGLGWTRFVRQRLYIPRGTPTHLQVDIEQKPRLANRVELSGSLDATGRPTTVIQWTIAEEDHQAIRAAAARFLARWLALGSPAKRNPTWDAPRLEATFGDATEPRPYDVYHPVGTCRMGVDSEAVVNQDLAVYGTENLYVASTAVLPSAGTANPTFSMLCLTAALAAHLEGVHSGS
jgi:choline dehydrogenase-like flavoprotein